MLACIVLETTGEEDILCPGFRDRLEVSGCAGRRDRGRCLAPEKSSVSTTVERVPELTSFNLSSISAFLAFT